MSGTTQEQLAAEQPAYGELGRLPAGYSPACADNPRLWDSTKLADHIEAARGCVGCPATLPCALVGRLERGTGTFAGQLLRDGIALTRAGLQR